MSCEASLLRVGGVCANAAREKMHEARRRRLNALGLHPGFKSSRDVYQDNIECFDARTNSLTYTINMKGRKYKQPVSYMYVGNRDFE